MRIYLIPRLISEPFFFRRSAPTPQPVLGGNLEGEMKGESNQAMTATDGIAIKMWYDGIVV
jgi:hypothetical protein